MSCTICGRVTMPGGKLCVQCKAALKRARQQTVSQVEPLRRRTKAGAKRRSARKDEPSAQPLPPVLPPPVQATLPRRLRLPVTLVVMGVLIYAAGYFGDQLSSASAVQNLVRAASAPAPSGSVANMPAPLAPPEPFHVVDNALPLPPSSAVAPANPSGSKPAGKIVPKPKYDSKVIASVPSLADFGPVTEPPAAAEPAPPPAPRPPEAPPPDRWQLMSNSIARCGESDGFVAGVICEQRVRLQYCDGYWDQVAQCAGRVDKERWQ